MPHSFTIVIPARYASTRLPKKLLLDLNGKPVIQHTYEKAKLANARNIYIATDNSEIENVARSFAANVIMTRQDHASGTDRLVEVVEKLKLTDDEIIVNVQADEPLIPVDIINTTAELLQQNPDADLSTMATPIKDIATVFDPNKVKVVINKNQQALYFSRAPIPWDRENFTTVNKKATELNHAPYYLHIGIYGYRVKTLHVFAKMNPAPIEQAEKLEQLRAMWYGMKIQVGIIDNIPAHGIDTEQDLQRLRDQLKTSK